MAPLPQVTLNLRLPKKRHRELKRTAERNKTSLNAEILRRLAWDDASVDHEYQWFWLIHTVQLIWERLDGIQAQAGRPRKVGSRHRNGHLKPVMAESPRERAAHMPHRRGLGDHVVSTRRRERARADAATG